MAQERRMRRHLPGCTACRALYASLSMAEGSGPEAAARRHARFEASLFGRDPEVEVSRAGWPIFRVALSAAAAVLLAGLVAIIAHHGNADDAWRAKGPSRAVEGVDLDRWVSVTVFRPRAKGGYEPLAKHIGRNGSLAFSYSNASKKLDRLMIFGVDEHGEVYWYYPAWTEPEKDPKALIVRSGKRIRLPQQVTHEYKGGRLRIFALFHARHDLSVRGIEAEVRRLVARGVSLMSLERFPLPGSGQHILSYEVSP